MTLHHHHVFKCSGESLSDPSPHTVKSLSTARIHSVSVSVSVTDGSGEERAGAGESSETGPGVRQDQSGATGTGSEPTHWASAMFSLPSSSLVYED